MISLNYSPWFNPQPEASLIVSPKQREADLKLIVDTCYAAILNCDDPAVRWEAARLLQQIGPMKELPHA